jgi:hypothetical protein
VRLLWVRQFKCQFKEGLSQVESHCWGTHSGHP